MLFFGAAHHQQQQREQQQQQQQVKPRGSMFLEVVPSFSSMVFRCGEGCVLAACSTCSSSTSSRSSSSSCYVPIRGPTAAAAKASAAAGALFLPESRRDVKPRDSMFLEVVPSFFFSMGFRSYVRHSEEEQQQQEQQEGSMSNCTHNGTKSCRTLLFF